ncbi:head completion/stabilization protein [Aggregatibacter actinomycetemcomitans]|uniref:head completion/stabilization protein n=1 Tax=Aggregatibacter actinomycetemcomitans TaxID=714 RepID=UPI00197B25A6|nr:head completion/stabilization protein [Aggregatibacter actinomycetemcomitans]MBN6064182.1 head completion/stabilization protein [Aggregatibacter actinomycetemcomitans]MBN6081259.1 head completion/stabilization protein [Aggregatibacter actinomycetemcomitans]MBN6084025.1 head completion/stabilization protein [Aggregatibacter actinomycetemcomitans]
MSDGSISIKLAPDYEMGAVQKQVEDYGQGEDLVLNDTFFPPINISDFRNQARVDGTVTTTRLKDALIEAIASVNDELSDFKQHSKADYFADIPCAKINNESVLVYRYRRAVTCLALANLYERYASYDTGNDGEKKMELLQNSINELRRDARFAISDILKRPRVDAELI